MLSMPPADHDLRIARLDGLGPEGDCFQAEPQTLLTVTALVSWGAPRRDSLPSGVHALGEQTFPMITSSKYTGFADASRHSTSSGNPSCRIFPGRPAGTP